MREPLAERSRETKWVNGLDACECWKEQKGKMAYEDGAMSATGPRPYGQDAARRETSDEHDFPSVRPTWKSDARHATLRRSTRSPVRRIRQWMYV